MRLRTYRSVAALTILTAVALSLLIAGTARAQQVYTNVVNQRFRTVGNGPQSAMIVDMDAGADTATIRKAAQNAYVAMRAARDPIMQRELALMRRRREIKPGRQLDVVDVAIVRQSGRLATQSFKPNQTRAAGGRAPGNDITFNIPTGSGNGQWSVAKAQQLSSLIGTAGGGGLYSELKTILGAPAWSGQVTVLNLDPNLGKVSEIIGALVVINTDGSIEIEFPSFNDAQTEFLAMAQVMAQCFHGPARIGYDAWEQGMARAASVIAAKDLQKYPGTATAIDPANGFYYTPDYDLLNQPALGNNTFTPPTKSGQVGPTINPTQYGGMLVPRLQMSGTAWLKCYIENPSFFINFNAAYYTAWAADHTAANDVNRLRTYAASALPNVEGQAFNTWFEQQFVLDTSITYGVKLYAHVSATFPDPATNSPAGAAVFLIYYQTTSSGDELDLNGICQVVYWDYSFQNRLFLPSFDQVTVADGFGTVAPYFTGIGGNPPNQMRVAMDFPLNKEYNRVYFPAGQTGTETSPNAFSGVVVGQDSGTLSAQFDSGGTITTVTPTFAQGEFGGTGSIGTGFSRTKLTLNGAGPLTYMRNVFIRPGDIAPIFQLVAPAPTVTLNHSFASGLQMISLPTKPLSGDLARAIGADPTTALMAQFRQDSTGVDQYLRYPSLPTYQPGYALWANFASTVTNPSGIVGQPVNPIIQPNVTVALEYGWNQIGSPYALSTNLNVQSDIQFVHQGSDPVGYADAVTAGYIADAVIGYSPSTGYEDITRSTDTTIFPLNQLVTWSGYWVQVLMTEGVSMTYVAPSGSRAAGSRVAKPISRAVNVKPEAGSWSVPLVLSDTLGHRSAAILGQSARGADAYVASQDLLSPPAMSGMATLSLRFPAKDGIAGTNQTLMRDIRRSAAKANWSMTVNLPQGEQSYTLSWSNAATAPHGMRLTLLDSTTGARILMNNASSYTFIVGKGETTRAFQVVAEPRSIGRLMISNVSTLIPRSTGGRAPTSVTISYELSGPAQASVQVRLNGRVVRHVMGNGRAAETGVNQLVWDLKDDKGIVLPGGAYQLEISAKSSEGEQTRTVVPMLITR